jgi:hypothetical protein
MSASGAIETCRGALTMSRVGGRPEAAGTDAIDPLQACGRPLAEASSDRKQAPFSLRAGSGMR